MVHMVHIQRALKVPVEGTHGTYTALKVPVEGTHRTYTALKVPVEGTHGTYTALKVPVEGTHRTYTALKVPVDPLRQCWMVSYELISDCNRTTLSLLYVFGLCKRHSNPSKEMCIPLRPVPQGGTLFCLCRHWATSRNS